MSQYAKDTTVSIEASESEIRNILRRYGADQFISGWSNDQAIIGFRVANRQVKIVLPMPDKADKRFKRPGGGNASKSWTSEEAAMKAWEQACKQRWRALVLIVKAKLEAIESGISTVEREFLADVVMSDGSTFYEWAKPQVEQMYLSGKMPPLLIAGPGEKR